MKAFQGGCLVFILAVASYANSLGNGFAYDDNAVLSLNPVVSSGDWRGALTSPYHPDALEGAGLYRPLTSFSFSLEWRLFGGNPGGFHLLNVLIHGGVSILVFSLLLHLGSPLGAMAGGALFAVHPVHTEAVANVVGRAELYAALFFLLACLLYWRGGEWTGWRRAFRLLGIGALYALSLSAKEIGVTLPLVLLLLEAARPLVGRRRQGLGALEGRRDPTAPSFRSWLSRVRYEGAVFLLLFVVLVAYLGTRAMILGTLSGEVAAPVFRMLTPEQRLLTAVSLWSQYARLLLFPLDLAADYAPGVLFPAESLDPGVLLGGGILLVLVLLAIRGVRSQGYAALLGLGAAWFAVVILPVSNLLFPVGVLLAERTLYLPSVGLSMAAGALVAWAAKARPPAPLVTGVAFVLVVSGMTIRTVLRNPSWMSTYTVLETLNRDHPESHLAFLNRGVGLEEVGDVEKAREEFAMAVGLAPQRYGTLTAAAGFLGRAGESSEAEELLRRAMGIAPSRDDAYRLLAAQMLRQGRGREAHRVALEGLARAGFHPDLWGAVSESYVLKGDLEAAVRAREAALAADPDSTHHLRRLQEILTALGRDQAGAARPEPKRGSHR